MESKPTAETSHIGIMLTLECKGLHVFLGESLRIYLVHRKFGTWIKFENAANRILVWW